MTSSRPVAHAVACLCSIAATVAISLGLALAASPDERSSTAVAVGPETIVDVQWHSSPQVHPGSLVEATVLTSDDIGYVEGHIRSWSINFVKVAPGKFQLRYRVPLLPPMALGTWNVDVIAHSMDGISVRRVYRITYRYF
jgi:hypothetical protein